MNRVSRKRRRVNALCERNITIRCPRSVSPVSVGGLCLRDLGDHQIATVSSSLQAIPFPAKKWEKPG